MFKIFKKIFPYFFSLVNVLFYSFIFFLLKNILKKKIVLFYYGLVGSPENHIILAKELIKNFKKKNDNITFFIFLDFFLLTKFNKFINRRHLKYLININILIVNHSKFILPLNTINILLPHDIYDSFPWKTESLFEPSELHLDSEKFLFQFQYILCPNLIVKNMFIKKINLLKKNKEAFYYLNLRKEINLLDAGYFKLDYIDNKIKNYKRKDSILLLPSIFGFFTTDYVIELIKKINTTFHKYNVILRPHPAHYRQNKKFYQKLLFCFRNNSKFILDTNSMYIESFSRSIIAISESSGSSYTYAFSTLRPVLFVFLNKLNSYQKSTYYYRDIKKIGILSKNTQDILIKIKKLISNQSNFQKKIFIFRKKRIKFYGKSSSIFCDLLKNITKKNNLEKIKVTKIRIIRD